MQFCIYRNDKNIFMRSRSSVCVVVPKAYEHRQRRATLQQFKSFIIHSMDSTQICMLPLCLFRLALSIRRVVISSGGSFFVPRARAHSTRQAQRQEWKSYYEYRKYKKYKIKSITTNNNEKAVIEHFFVVAWHFFSVK